MVGLCLQAIFELLPVENREDLRIISGIIDENGRERFYLFPFRVHFNELSNKISKEWIHFRPFHHNLFGYEALSERTISFHYIQPSDMYQIDSILHDIRQFDRDVCLSYL